MQLVQEVKRCRKCPRMNSSERVLGPASGSVDANIMFIGEAPGRLGADESQIPFHGDKSGHNFESLLDHVGLIRYDLFVTNAVLCNPKDEKGNNSTPNAQEIGNCAEFLRTQVSLIDPAVVVTLGATALKSCALVEPHMLGLKDSVRSVNSWFDRKLIPAYHPGQRAMIHRSFGNQLADYQFIAETYRRLIGRTKRKSSRGIVSNSTKDLIDELTRRKPTLSYFALHKLYFLAEARAFESLGARLTDSYIIRQKDGPYCVDLHPVKLMSNFSGLEVVTKRGKLLVQRDLQQNLLIGTEFQTTFTPQQIMVIDNIVAKYGILSDAELKQAVYMSKPMRTVLRKEKQLGTNLFNTPLLVQLSK